MPDPRRVLRITWLPAVVALAGCSGQPEVADATPDYSAACRATTWVEPPACGSGKRTFQGLLPGPGEKGFDADLDAKALRLERQFHTFNTYATDVNIEATVPADATEARLAITSFLVDGDGWDFEKASGKKVTDVIAEWAKVAGGYAGVGIAADGFRYATLRDQGGDCDDIERARGFIEADLDVLHMVVAITGRQGSIARGFARRDVPGMGATVETTPLFDADGQALPRVKNNGTWREDFSGGDYPNTVWEDSCSRDMLIGWVIAYAGLWEVIELDPGFDAADKTRLQADAAAVARSLMVVRDNGYDLEIVDPDGRRTLNGILNEQSLDLLYIPGARYGFNAIMALGIIAALDYVAEQPDIDAYLYEQLIGARHLDVMARDDIDLVDLGVKSNFSDYNMSFQGGWLATRYLCDATARGVASEAVQTSLYELPDSDRQPVEQKQTFYDFVQAAAVSGSTAWASAPGAPDQGAVDRGMQSLAEFWEPPYFAEARMNCDQTEIDSTQCVALDGTKLTVLGTVGRNGALVAKEPLPMRTRPASNYYWRSNPYEVNGEGDGSGLYGAPDFRFAYWLARWVKR